MTNLKKANSEKETYGKGQFWRGTFGTIKVLNKRHLKKGNSGKDNSEKGQFWKGKSER